MLVMVLSFLNLSAGFMSARFTQQVRDSSCHQTRQPLPSRLYALDLKRIEVPRQTELSKYSTLVCEKFPSDKILKWYIHKVVDQTAIIELVVSVDDDDEDTATSTIVGKDTIQMVTDDDDDDYMPSFPLRLLGSGPDSAERNMI